MYYNGYYPYNSNYQTQQQYQQPTYQAQQQVFQPQVNNLATAYVNGLEGAKTYVVLPNQTFFLFDNEKGMLFVKSVDNQGKCNMDTYYKNKVQENNSSNFEERLKKLEEYIYATKQSNANTTNAVSSTE